MDPFSYLPHAREIIAISEILETSSQNITCRATGGRSVFHVIECCAQAAAVGRITQLNEQTPRFGVIVRIKEFTSFSDTKEKELRLSCSWSESIGSVYEVVGEATVNGENKIAAKVVMTLMEFQ